MAEAAKKLSKMLQAIDNYHNFANGNTSRKGGFQTSRTIERASSGFLIHVNLARFPESVKSWRTMSTSRIGAWAASAALLIRVVQEPTWARRTDVGLRPFSLFPKITTHPNLWNYEHDKPSAGIAILKVSLSH